MCPVPWHQVHYSLYNMFQIPGTIMTSAMNMLRVLPHIDQSGPTHKPNLLQIKTHGGVMRKKADS